MPFCFDILLRRPKDWKKRVVGVIIVDVVGDRK